jgi:hypothetical protein
MWYWVETIHGVVVDVVSTIDMAKQQVRGPGVPKRAFFIEGGVKKYCA